VKGSIERRHIGEIAQLERRPVNVDLSHEYHEIGIRSFGRGVFHKEPVSGAALGAKRVFRIKPGDLLLNNVFAWEGAIAVADEEQEGRIGSHRFMSYVVDRNLADTHYLLYYLLSESGLELIRRASPGSAGRNRTLGIKAFESLEVPLPPPDVQRQIALRLDMVRSKAEELRSHQSVVAQRLTALVAALVTRADLSDRQKLAHGWLRRVLGEFLSPSGSDETVDPNRAYRIAGVYSFGRGLIDRGTIGGHDTKYRSLTRLTADDIIVSRLGGWEGAVAVVPERFDGAYVSAEYPVFTPDRENIDPDYFAGIARSQWLWDAIGGSTRGSMARRKRVKAEDFLSVEVWLPPPAVQSRVASLINKAFIAEGALEHSRSLVAALGPAALNKAFANLT
jgi:type I restriction enzyme, S subunit